MAGEVEALIEWIAGGIIINEESFVIIEHHFAKIIFALEFDINFSSLLLTGWNAAHFI